MFESREALEDIYPSLVGYAFYDFKCTDVFSFLGRKLNAKFLGEAVSDYRKRPVGWRIKFKLKSNSIKMYDKFNCLRIEMTINDPKEFKVYKEDYHKDLERLRRQWVPMGEIHCKPLSVCRDFKNCKQTVLDSMCHVIPQKAWKRKSIISARKESKGKNFTVDIMYVFSGNLPSFSKRFVMAAI